MGMYLLTTVIVVVSETCPSDRDSEGVGVTMIVQVYVSVSEVRRVLN